MKRINLPVLSSFILFFALNHSTCGQFIIEPAQGYSTQTGNMVAMLDDLKERVTNSVSKLTIEETDFLLDDEANSIGALILHLAATEKLYQVRTFENRPFNHAQIAEWGVAQKLGDTAREQIRNKPIVDYLTIWNEVREETRRLLKTKNDEWFTSKRPGREMNNHWAWFHVMEHQANHMGQIQMILKRFEK